MNALAEVVRQLGLVLLGWTLVSLVAVWPIVWWMRRRAALNEEALTWMGGRSLDGPAEFSATGSHSIAGGLPRS